MGQEEYIPELEAPATADNIISFTLLKAELVGTFMFVYMVAWARLCVDLFTTDYLVASIVAGVTLAILLSITGKAGNVTFNPALTIGYFVLGQMRIWETISVVITQLLAGFLASAALTFTAGDSIFERASKKSKVGLPMLGSNFRQLEAFSVECCGTMFLFLVFVIIKNDKSIMPQIKGFLVGGTLMVCMCCFYNVSGACFNPAFVFGPSFLSRYIVNYQWFYYFGPLMGGILGGIIFSFIRTFLEKHAGTKKTDASQERKKKFKHMIAGKN